MDSMEGIIMLLVTYDHMSDTLVTTAMTGTLMSVSLPLASLVTIMMIPTHTNTIIVIVVIFRDNLNHGFDSEQDVTID